VSGNKKEMSSTVPREVLEKHLLEIPTILGRLTELENKIAISPETTDGLRQPEIGKNYRRIIIIRRTGSAFSPKHFSEYSFLTEKLQKIYAHIIEVVQNLENLPSQHVQNLLKLSEEFEDLQDKEVKQLRKVTDDLTNIIKGIIDNQNWL
jgi:hypothetical protein